MNSGHRNTIKQLLQQARQKIDPLDAELLLAHVLNKPREWILVHTETKITKKQEKRYKQLLVRRANGEPIAYLTGHKEFFGLDFVVNKNVLIPRPDTEILVESVLKQFQNSKFKIQNSLLIDVGTGSGCIPIAILKNLQTCTPANLHTIAIDISKPALATARRNANKHKVKIKFLHSNLVEPILKAYSLKLKAHNLIITANLPYLTKKQFDNSPTIQFEPQLALIAKNNGLALYKKLLKQIKKLVTGYQLPVTCFFEIDPSQSKSITSIIKSILPDAKTQIIKDLAGIDRVVKIEVNNINGSKPKK